MHRQTSQLPHTKVLTYNQLLFFGQKSPKVPIRSGAGGVPGFSTLWLCAGVSPLVHPASQLSPGGAVMTTSGGEARGGERTWACLPPNVGSTPSHPAASYSACNATIRVPSLGLRQQVANCALLGPKVLRGEAEESRVTKRTGFQALL